MVTAAVARKQAPDKILKLITSRRRRLNVEAPQIWAIRRAVAGVTHNRGLKETRGRKKKLTKVQVNRLFTKRKEMVQKADKQYNVSYDMVSTAARVPEVHRTTTARYLGSKGVKWRRMREKAARTEAHEEQRKHVNSILRKRPESFWTEDVHRLHLSRAPRRHLHDLEACCASFLCSVAWCMCGMYGMTCKHLLLSNLM